MVGNSTQGSLPVRINLTTESLPTPNRPAASLILSNMTPTLSTPSLAGSPLKPHLSTVRRIIGASPSPIRARGDMILCTSELEHQVPRRPMLKYQSCSATGTPKKSRPMAAKPCIIMRLPVRRPSLVYRRAFPCFLPHRYCSSSETRIRQLAPQGNAHRCARPIGLLTQGRAA